MKKHPQVWGITGGMGSGKSQVAAILEDMGAYRIDTDALARALTAPDGAAIAPIVRAFGPSCLDQNKRLQRDHLRERIFNHPQDKKQLEDILHPLIFQEVLDSLAHCSRPYVIIEIPLLAEAYSKWAPLLDEVWLVQASQEAQIRRVQQRNQWPTEHIKKVIQQQASPSERLRIATVVIDNENDDLLALNECVRQKAHELGL